IHAAATTRSPRASGVHRERAHRLPPGHPRTRHAGATTCSPRALVSIEDALTGCPPDILGPATRERRLVHLGGPVSIEDVLTGCPRDILGPATRVRRLVHRWSPRLPPFDPRGILRSIHPVAPTCAARAYGGCRGRCSRAASWTS